MKSFFALKDPTAIQLSRDQQPPERTPREGHLAASHSPAILGSTQFPLLVEGVGKKELQIGTFISAVWV